MKTPTRPPMKRVWRTQRRVEWAYQVGGLLTLAGLLYICFPDAFAGTIFSNAVCYQDYFSDNFHQEPVIDPVPILRGEPAQRLPWISTSERTCERTLVIRLDSEYGFGSMLMLLALPGLAMADLYGYTPLIDDSDFNYGRITDYFKPLRIDCTPHPDWKTAPRVEYAQPGWRASDHVYIARHAQYTEVHVDLFWRNEWMRKGQREGVVRVDNKLFEDKSLRYLPSDMTFTPALRPAYRAITHSLNELWQLNDFMLKEVEGLVANTRGARRSGRPVLGVTLRLGDKGRELSWNPGPNSYGNYQGFLDMAKEQLYLLTSEEDTRSPNEKPILLVMSDDVKTALSGLRALPDSDLFELRGLEGEVSEVDLPSSDDRFSEALASSKSAQAAPKGGHEQTHFNALPVTARIASARKFIRDLHYMSRHTDAISVSSGSNAGRVALILAGEEKAYGFSDARGDVDGGGRKEAFRSIGGLARSLDTRWFPCVFYKGCFL